jgi:hypothetical protein
VDGSLRVWGLTDCASNVACTYWNRDMWVGGKLTPADRHQHLPKAVTDEADVAILAKQGACTP